jgi:hypothetical protein
MISAINLPFQKLRYLQLTPTFRSLNFVVISHFQESDAAIKCHHKLTEILSKSILDIWMISKLKRVNPSLWIPPFCFLKRTFLGPFA